MKTCAGLRRFFVDFYESWARATYRRVLYPPGIRQRLVPHRISGRTGDAVAASDACHIVPFRA